MTNRAFNIWLAAFLTFSIGYILIRSLSPFDLDWVIKCTPILLLIYLCSLSLSGKTKTFMQTALVFSMLGDFLLSLNGYFLLGLGSFLLAQLVYAGFFFTQFKMSRQGTAWAMGIMAYLAIAGYFILPKAGDFSFAIIAYMSAISLMAIAAGFRHDNRFLVVALGAFIFIISDTIIAVNMFVAPFEWAGAFIMITYYLAQLLITLGIINQKKSAQEIS